MYWSVTDGTKPFPPLMAQRRENNPILSSTQHWAPDRFKSKENICLFSKILSDALLLNTSRFDFHTRGKDFRNPYAHLGQEGKRGQESKDLCRIQTPHKGWQLCYHRRQTMNLLNEFFFLSFNNGQRDKPPSSRKPAAEQWGASSWHKSCQNVQTRQGVRCHTPSGE